jgi:undecaprenyl diphosphate synthase
MKKSNLQELPAPPAAPLPATGLHLAIIMDGNGRWASARGLPRVAGHRSGATAVRRTVEAALQLGIRTLTLYAFSADNWKRPPQEVGTLMGLFGEYLRKEAGECAQNGVRISVIGRRDRLPASIVQAIEEAERTTAPGGRLDLRIAVDYSSRDAIVEAARRANGRGLSREEFSGLLGAAIHGAGTAAEVDLLIRTGGEQRLSDFLLWECAYAELYFTRRMWPEFGAADLEAALAEFRGRERRFGAAPAAAQIGRRTAGGPNRG